MIQKLTKSLHTVFQIGVILLMFLSPFRLTKSAFVVVGCLVVFNRFVKVVFDVASF